MRIGIMLRAYDRAGGIGIYSKNIVENLLALDDQNEYLLAYNSKDHLGTYQHLANVEEYYIPRANQLVWDQWLAPKRLCGKGAELIFNTKFSVPLTARVPTVMVLHGASWFVHPELYSKADILYVRAAMPLYCRSADFLIANSDLTRNDFIRILRVPERKIRTVMLAADPRFMPITREDVLDAAKNKYGLPDDFILTVTSYDPRKNFSTLLAAFEKVRKKADIQLVVVGKNCDRYGKDYDLAGRGLEQTVRFLGWIEQDDLPAIYSLATAFAFPSVYEEFGIPVVEAMACGCPVVSATTGAIPELVQDAGLLSDPFDSDTLAQHLLELATNQTTRAALRTKGLKRASDFSWEKAGRDTLEILKTVGQRAGSG